MSMPLFSSVLKLHNLSLLPLYILRFSYLESKLFIVTGRPVCVCLVIIFVHMQCYVGLWYGHSSLTVVQWLDRPGAGVDASVTDPG